jgi:5-hydroxyisourate hydrolase
MGSLITTHVLDTSLGRPAANVGVTLEHMAKSGWKLVGKGTTNIDGRLLDLLPEESLKVGRYRLTFAVEKYFKHRRASTFFPSVEIEFTVTAPKEHYHVPLLVSPYGYSTYRGS